MDSFVLHRGDCLEVLKTLPSESIESLVTDPPAGIAFMGKEWDHHKGGRTQWITWLCDVMKECLRVLKPGAHGLVWAIPRTSHWTATALEDAGFEIRDVVTHIFGSGFPKSLNVTKQIEKEYECQFLGPVKDAEHQFKLVPVVSNAEKIDIVLGHVAIQRVAEKEHPIQIGVVVDSKDQTDISLYVSKEKTDSNTSLLWKQLLNVDSSEASKCITLTKLKTIIDLKIWNLLQYRSTLKSTTSLNGTSLKPASEHWVLVRKPISAKTVAANVLEHGTGGINIDVSRIGYANAADLEYLTSHNQNSRRDGNAFVKSGSGTDQENPKWEVNSQGRFPANLVLSHNDDCGMVSPEVEELDLVILSYQNRLDKDKNEDDYVELINKRDELLHRDSKACTESCAVAALDAQSGISKSVAGGNSGSNANPMSWTEENKARPRGGHTDAGGASRFFYVAKASKKDKENGLEDMPEVYAGIGDDRPSGQSMSRLDGRPSRKAKNTHPTVKSSTLMTYLIKLITPPVGTVLDPFMGSGSTGVAAIREGFKFIGIEREQDYSEIAKTRLQNELTKLPKASKVDLSLPEVKLDTDGQCVMF